MLPSRDPGPVWTHNEKDQFAAQAEQQQTRITSAEAALGDLSKETRALDARVKAQDKSMATVDDRAAQLQVRVARLERGLADLKARAGITAPAGEVSNTPSPAPPVAASASAEAMTVTGRSVRAQTRATSASPSARPQTRATSASPSARPQTRATSASPPARPQTRATSASASARPQTRATSVSPPARPQTRATSSQSHTNKARTRSVSGGRQSRRSTSHTVSPTGPTSPAISLHNLVSPTPSQSVVQLDGLPSLSDTPNRPRALSVGDIRPLAPLLPFAAPRRTSQFLSQAEVGVLEHERERRQTRPSARSMSSVLAGRHARRISATASRMNRVTQGRIGKVAKTDAKARGRARGVVRRGLGGIQTVIAGGARQVWHQRTWIAGKVVSNGISIGMKELYAKWTRK
ncbi:hypothetical protein SVAN01_04938 [Stagonosporopsis vannaccii]|nr:hypothetical protein SVAN01_04938 [Stagonosporopsis vannaccii]